MKRAIYIKLALLLLVGLDATAIAQNTQGNSTEPCDIRKGGCIQTSYDKFQDTTFVGMTSIDIYRNPRGFGGRLSLSAIYLSPGTKIVRPDLAVFYFNYLAISSDEANPFNDSQGIYLLIDGKPQSLGNVSLRKYDNATFRTWTYALTVPFHIMELIAYGNSVEMRAGSIEVMFDDNLKAAFRRLVQLAPKATPAPKKDDIAPPVKPPAPKRTLRRKRGRP